MHTSRGSSFTCKSDPLKRLRDPVLTDPENGSFLEWKNCKKQRRNNFERSSTLAETENQFVSLRQIAKSRNGNTAALFRMTLQWKSVYQFINTTETKFALEGDFNYKICQMCGIRYQFEKQNNKEGFECDEGNDRGKEVEGSENGKCEKDEEVEVPCAIIAACDTCVSFSSHLRGDNLLLFHKFIKTARK